MAAAAIKMDELLVSWLGNDTVWEEIQNLVESYRKNNATLQPSLNKMESSDPKERGTGVIPPFYPKVSSKSSATEQQQQQQQRRMMQRWKSAPCTILNKWSETQTAPNDNATATSVRDQVKAILEELDTKTFGINDFTRITKEICQFPSFFSGPLFTRIATTAAGEDTMMMMTRERVTLEMLQHFYQAEIEPYDSAERFFRLVKQPANDYIVKEDFLPFIKELLNDHPVSYYKYMCAVVA
jgi:EF-hand domain